jgi:uncharacterized protein (DUF983 family)
MSLFRSKNSGGHYVVDLRTPVAEPSAPAWGSPSACPSCGGRGYVDHLDLFDEIMYLHCTACGEKFVRARAEIGPADASA